MCFDLVLMDVWTLGMREANKIRELLKNVGVLSPGRRAQNASSNGMHENYLQKLLSKVAAKPLHRNFSSVGV